LWYIGFSVSLNAKECFYIRTEATSSNHLNDN